MRVTTRVAGLLTLRNIRYGPSIIANKPFLDTPAGGLVRLAEAKWDKAELPARVYEPSPGRRPLRDYLR